MKITRHAQSCFLIETKQSKVLIDPGSFVFNEEGLVAKDFQKIDLIIFTHEHQDHFEMDNLKKLIDINHPEILSTNSIRTILKDEIPDLKTTTIGQDEVHKFSDFTVQGFTSKHGPLPSGDTPPAVSGFVLTESDTKKSLYHPGDTIKLHKTDADVVAVPICGLVTLNIEEAKAELIRVDAKITIPMHYDNPKYPTDVADFENAMKDTGIEVKTLEWGESLEI